MAGITTGVARAFLMMSSPSDFAARHRNSLSRRSTYPVVDGMTNNGGIEPSAAERVV